MPHLPRSGQCACFLAVVSLHFINLAFPLSAADWPQWSGIQRNNQSPERGLLQEWPENGPALLRAMKGLGKGYSSELGASHRLRQGPAETRSGAHAAGCISFDGAGAVPKQTYP